MISNILVDLSLASPDTSAVCAVFLSWSPEENGKYFTLLSTLRTRFRSIEVWKPAFSFFTVLGFGFFVFVCISFGVLQSSFVRLLGGQFLWFKFFFPSSQHSIDSPDAF